MIVLYLKKKENNNLEGDQTIEKRYHNTTGNA